MLASGNYPDHNVFPSVLKSCSLMKNWRFGESVHGCIIRLGMDFDLYTCNALMNMYSKFWSLEHGGQRFYDSEVLDRIPERREIVNVLYQVSTDKEVPDEGKPINVCCKKEKRCYYLGCLRKVFEMMPKRDVVSWNTVIAGHAQNGMHEEALQMVMEMGKADLRPDSFTLSGVLPVFTEYVNLLKGKEIHGYAIRNGYEADEFIGSSLIDMYAKCNRVNDSYGVFNMLPQHDGISWNSIIAGCVQNGMFDEGLKFFQQMLIAKIKPTYVSFSSIIPAFAHLTALNLGKQFHGYIIRSRFDDNIFIASALVNMYAKCGNIRIARCIFDKMELHDMVAWTAIIMGYALHGNAYEAISLFKQMELEGVRPNSVAFVAVLTACSHAGLVDEAWRYFNSMTRDYQINPGLEHYAAVADLLGRVGRLEEAYEFISDMQIKPEGSVWSTLLSACRVHKNIELAEKVFKKILALDPENIGAYVLLSNIYSAAGRWRDVRKLRISMRDKGMRTKPGCSWIEVKNKV